MGLATTTKTVQKVITRIQRQFGDESGAQITQSDFIEWINSGQLEIVKRNKILKDAQETSTVIGQFDYTFDSLNILEILHLHYNGIPLRNVSFQNMQEHILKTDPLRINSGDPLMWSLWDTTLSVYPTPSVVGTLTLYYVQMPTNVSTSSDLLSIPDTYYESLIQYVLGQAYELDDDWTGAATKIKQLDSSLNLLAKDETSFVNGSTYPVITVLAEDM